MVLEAGVLLKLTPDGLSGTVGTFTTGSVAGKTLVLSSADAFNPIKVKPISTEATPTVSFLIANCCFLDCCFLICSFLLLLDNIF